MDRGMAQKIGLSPSHKKTNPFSVPVLRAPRERENTEHGYGTRFIFVSQSEFVFRVSGRLKPVRRTPLI
jgi:hypothetical protein